VQTEIALSGVSLSVSKPVCVCLERRARWQCKLARTWSVYHTCVCKYQWY